jgi:hypothetical protein
VPLCEWHHYEVEKRIAFGANRVDAHIALFGPTHADERRKIPLSARLTMDDVIEQEQQRRVRRRAQEPEVELDPTSAKYAR